LENQGLIKAFEFTHELSWNLLKDYFDYQGTVGINGSRDAAREAFSKGLLTDGEAWMEMIKSRNQTSHTYNKKVADEIVGKILESYFGQFTSLLSKMREISNQK
jgi:nucleotidyltransferase substrate binding protein (TIGR01987 family)